LWWRLFAAGSRSQEVHRRLEIDEAAAECDMTAAATKAAASRILRAIGVEIMHKQAFTMATFIQELRNEEQFVADFVR
jgi:hypothetical protein